MKRILLYLVGGAIFVALLLILILFAIRPEIDMAYKPSAKPIHLEASTHVGVAILIDAATDYANGNIPLAIGKIIIGLYGIFRRDSQPVKSE